jgi:signal transduction histidine kinase
VVDVGPAVFYCESGEMENVTITANWYSGNGIPPTPLGQRYSTKVFTIASHFNSTDPGFVGNTLTDERVDPATRKVFQAQKICAFVSLPIWVNGRQAGSFLLQSEEAIAFTGKELLPYTSIMQQVTNALVNQNLIEQTQKRALELQSVATVSTTVSTVLDPDKLLQAVVDLTKERFNIYHSHIYLADESWNTLLLAAGAGEVGRQMVDAGHAIQMDVEKSLVARAARGRNSIIVNDVRSEVGFLPNPMLPETRSEMAVPMIAGDKVIGVFDVQADTIGHFTDEDANIYTTLASQVAVALQNARLYVEQAAAVTQLRELDRLKSSFLANMSHELRTPLNSILGFADVMLEGLDGPLTDNMNNDLGLIQKNGQHLLHLINDVLDMAKIDSGKMNLHVEKFNVHELFMDVISITSSLAKEKSIALIIENDSNQEVEVNADKIRLRQVMINLVNNAMKFTEKGQVTIHATREENNILISVKDTGIGIPADHLESVFQEFTQVDTTTTRKAGGTGLGLPISRRLINMHSGRLWAESSGVTGEGSTFYVHLPIEANINENVTLAAA